MAKKVLMQAVNLAQLSDGYTGKLLDKALLDVCNDIDDRPDGKERKIVLPGEIDAACKEAVDWLERQVTEERNAQGFACPIYRGVAA